jgi:hypothetical protein
MEGGYNPLSFPHLSTLKYKCRPTITTTITATVSVTTMVIVTSTTTIIANVTSTCNLSLLLSSILNQILSHGSYTKETSQIDVQHHQHMHLPSMYQDHQHTITRYVSQPCTIPSINRVAQHVP